MIKKSTDRSPVEYGENLPYVKGHFQRLEHVVINLIQNACQTLPDRERGIFLSTRCVPSQDVVLIEVRDEGLGIPPEQLGHITDPFFTTQRHSGHIGLGLWVSATIIHQHGGALEFSSVPGVGTTATIRLPAYHEDEGKSRG